MEYSVEDKLAMIDRVHAGETQLDVAKDVGCSRRSIINWMKQEGKLRGDLKKKEMEVDVMIPERDIRMVVDAERAYLAKLEELGTLEERKKALMMGVEKRMWDLLSGLDGSYEDIKADVRVKMLKDLNEIREKLSGEPSVIIEYRKKFQMAVMMVVQDMLPGKEREFVERVKAMEEGDVV